SISRDWSSDVCSSDLPGDFGTGPAAGQHGRRGTEPRPAPVSEQSRRERPAMIFIAVKFPVRPERSAEWMDLVAEFTAATRAEPRSEEHTSELQSRENLVCRLLLEKKNVSVYTIFFS